MSESLVPFSDVFTSDFMEKHTKYNSFNDFLTAGGFQVNSHEDLKSIPDAEIDSHVVKFSDFSSWEEMLSEAAKQYVSKKFKKQ
ncbi:hypothetical protein [Desulfotomaculum sp. 1211_IL3151]|uniref:hypothetical protein n=1 Tax=Desulfotomaculum sp. 1211_IL3151 TaxID=3084055 RepID=UPI002FD99C01